MAEVKTVAIYTLGCKVNQFESAALAVLFKDRGYRVVDFDSPADVYVINTCTVTHLADRKSRQVIRRATRTSPGALIVVTGCYAQVAPDEVLKIPGVDLVVGTRDRTRIVELVEMAKKNDGPFNAVADLSGVQEFEELPAGGIPGRARAFLKIQEGCDNYCTYCIVPYARGPLRSLRPERVMEEVQKLLAAGYREIVLTGIRTGAYGRDLDGDVDLPLLISSLSSLPGRFRLRLSSVEPQDVSPRLIEVLASSPVMCRHLHLPLQSGDDWILRRMGRRYGTGEFRQLVADLRRAIPGIAVTTDVIVGFPGERVENFNNTCRFVEEIGFAGLHVFKYSPRRSTPAAGFSGQVTPEEKEVRSRKLTALGYRLARRFAFQQVGTELEVLVERPYERRPGYYEGHTDNYLVAVFPAGAELRGELVRVRVECVRGRLLQGKII